MHATPEGSAAATKVDGSTRPGVTPGERLVRSMGQWDLLALTVNSLIASAIYVMPGTIAGLTGAWSPYVHIVAALVTLIFVLIFAEVSSRFASAGGPYLYAYEAFGPFIGFEVGWIAYLTRLAAIAANYNLFITYLGYFFPGIPAGIGKAIVLFLLIAFLTIMNIRGVRQGARTVDFITIAKLAPLFVLIAAGMFFIDTGNLRPGQFPSSENILRSIFLLSFAYGGFEIATIPSGESVNPQRHVPRALVLALLTALAIFVCIQTVGVGVLPAFSGDDRPIAAVALALLGTFGGALVAFGALVSTFGYFGGSILSVPRLTFALSERNQLPRMFSLIHPRFKTPYVSIIIYSCVAFLLAIFSNFITLAAISVFYRLIYYITTSMALLKFRRTSRAPFTLSFGPLLPILGILFALILFKFTTREEVSYAVGGILAGTVVYFFVRTSGGKRGSQT
ncbi:MAG TPA: amino acid permease [Bacteroidota bacterium]|nr:amino acid permease [Bacteroidota bacterium]